MPAPKKSIRPKLRDAKKAGEYAAGKAVKRGNNAAKREAYDQKTLAKKKCGGKVKKMKSGGMCRGMGAATRGGKYSRV